MGDGSVLNGGLGGRCRRRRSRGAVLAPDEGGKDDCEDDERRKHRNENPYPERHAAADYSHEHEVGDEVAVVGEVTVVDDIVADFLERAVLLTLVNGVAAGAAAERARQFDGDFDRLTQFARGGGVDGGGAAHEFESDDAADFDGLTGAREFGSFAAVRDVSAVALGKFVRTEGPRSGLRGFEDDFRLLFRGLGVVLGDDLDGDGHGAAGAEGAAGDYLVVDGVGEGDDIVVHTRFGDFGNGGCAGAVTRGGGQFADSRSVDGATLRGNDTRDGHAERNVGTDVAFGHGTVDVDGSLPDIEEGDARGHIVVGEHAFGRVEGDFVRTGVGEGLGGGCAAGGVGDRSGKRVEHCFDFRFDRAFEGEESVVIGKFLRLGGVVNGRDLAAARNGERRFVDIVSDGDCRLGRIRRIVRRVPFKSGVRAGHLDVEGVIAGVLDCEVGFFAHHLEGVHFLHAVGLAVYECRKEVGVVKSVGAVVNAALSALSGDGERGQHDGDITGVRARHKGVVRGGRVCDIDGDCEFACGSGVNGEVAEGDLDAADRRREHIAVGDAVGHEFAENLGFEVGYRGVNDIFVIALGADGERRGNDIDLLSGRKGEDEVVRTARDCGHIVFAYADPLAIRLPEGGGSEGDCTHGTAQRVVDDFVDGDGLAREFGVRITDESLIALPGYVRHTALHDDGIIRVGNADGIDEPVGIRGSAAAEAVFEVCVRKRNGERSLGDDALGNGGRTDGVVRVGARIAESESDIPGAGVRGSECGARNGDTAGIGKTADGEPDRVQVAVVRVGVVEFLGESIGDRDGVDRLLDRTCRGYDGILQTAARVAVDKAGAVVQLGKVSGVIVSFFADFLKKPLHGKLVALGIDEIIVGSAAAGNEFDADEVTVDDVARIGVGVCRGKEGNAISATVVVGLEIAVFAAECVVHLTVHAVDVSVAVVSLGGQSECHLQRSLRNRASLNEKRGLGERVTCRHLLVSFVGSEDDVVDGDHSAAVADIVAVEYRVESDVENIGVIAFAYQSFQYFLETVGQTVDDVAESGIGVFVAVVLFGNPLQLVEVEIEQCGVEGGNLSEHAFAACGERVALEGVVNEICDAVRRLERHAGVLDVVQSDLSVRILHIRILLVAVRVPEGKGRARRGYGQVFEFVFAAREIVFVGDDDFVAAVKLRRGCAVILRFEDERHVDGYGQYFDRHFVEDERDILFVERGSEVGVGIEVEFRNRDTRIFSGVLACNGEVRLHCQRIEFVRGEHGGVKTDTALPREFEVHKLAAVVISLVAVVAGLDVDLVESERQPVDSGLDVVDENNDAASLRLAFLDVSPVGNIEIVAVDDERNLAESFHEEGGVDDIVARRAGTEFHSVIERTVASAENEEGRTELIPDVRQHAGEDEVAVGDDFGRVVCLLYQHVARKNSLELECRDIELVCVLGSDENKVVCRGHIVGQLVVAGRRTCERQPRNFDIEVVDTARAEFILGEFRSDTFNRLFYVDRGSVRDKDVVAVEHHVAEDERTNATVRHVVRPVGNLLVDADFFYDVAFRNKSVGDGELYCPKHFCADGVHLDAGVGAFVICRAVRSVILTVRKQRVDAVVVETVAQPSAVRAVKRSDDFAREDEFLEEGIVNQLHAVCDGSLHGISPIIRVAVNLARAGEDRSERDMEIIDGDRCSHNDGVFGGVARDVDLLRPVHKFDALEFDAEGSAVRSGGVVILEGTARPRNGEPFGQTARDRRFSARRGHGSGVSEFTVGIIEQSVVEVHHIGGFGSKAFRERDGDDLLVPIVIEGNRNAVHNGFNDNVVADDGELGSLRDIVNGRIPVELGRRNESTGDNLIGYPGGGDDFAVRGRVVILELNAVARKGGHDLIGIGYGVDIELGNHKVTRHAVYDEVCGDVGVGHIDRGELVLTRVGISVVALPLVGVIACGGGACGQIDRDGAGADLVQPGEDRRDVVAAQCSGISDGNFNLPVGFAVGLAARRGNIEFRLVDDKGQIERNRIVGGSAGGIDLYGVSSGIEVARSGEVFVERVADDLVVVHEDVSAARKDIGKRLSVVLTERIRTDSQNVGEQFRADFGIRQVVERRFLYIAVSAARPSSDNAGKVKRALGDGKRHLHNLVGDVERLILEDDLARERVGACVDGRPDHGRPERVVPRHFTVRDLSYGSLLGTAELCGTRRGDQVAGLRHGTAAVLGSGVGAEVHALSEGENKSEVAARRSDHTEIARLIQHKRYLLSAGIIAALGSGDFVVVETFDGIVHSERLGIVLIVEFNRAVLVGDVFADRIGNIACGKSLHLDCDVFTALERGTHGTGNGFVERNAVECRELREICGVDLERQRVCRGIHENAINAEVCVARLVERHYI